MLTPRSRSARGDRRLGQGWRSDRVCRGVSAPSYIGTSPRKAIGGLDEGAVVWCASNSPPDGVMAPLPSEPVPPLPSHGPGELAGIPDLLTLASVSPADCASARLGTRAKAIAPRTLAFIVAIGFFLPPYSKQITRFRVGKYDSNHTPARQEASFRSFLIL